MDNLPKEALTTLEESFGTRFVRHADRGVEDPGSEGHFASAFPQDAEEVELLARLSARHSIPLRREARYTCPGVGRALLG